MFEIGRCPKVEQSAGSDREVANEVGLFNLRGGPVGNQTAFAKTRQRAPVMRVQMNKVVAQDFYRFGVAANLAASSRRSLAEAEVVGRIFQPSEQFVASGNVPSRVGGLTGAVCSVRFAHAAKT